MILPTFLSLYHRARRIWVSALLNLNTLIAFNIGMITSTERLTSINIDAEVDWEQCVFRRSSESQDTILCPRHFKAQIRGMLNYCTPGSQNIFADQFTKLG